MLFLAPLAAWTVGEVCAVIGAACAATSAGLAVYETVRKSKDDDSNAQDWQKTFDEMEKASNSFAKHYSDYQKENAKKQDNND